MAADDERESEESFERIPSIRGKIFVPIPRTCKNKKHPCPDCFSCQACSDDRCRLCRRRKSVPPR